jgi:hypothetical protein
MEHATIGRTGPRISEISINPGVLIVGTSAEAYR